MENDPKRIVDIRGISKAKVLAALYNASKPQGNGWLNYDKNHIMTEEEAAGLIAEMSNREYIYFDYLRGRVLKIDLSTNYLNIVLYDRDNGPGAAECAIIEAL